MKKRQQTREVEVFTDRDQQSLTVVLYTNRNQFVVALSSSIMAFMTRDEAIAWIKRKSKGEPIIKGGTMYKMLPEDVQRQVDKKISCILL